MLTEKVRYFIDPGEPPVCDENSGFEVYFLCTFTQIGNLPPQLSIDTECGRV